MEGLRRSRRGFERGREGGRWSQGVRGRRSCGARGHGGERWRTGLRVHLGTPELALSGGLDLRLGLDLRDGVGLGLELGL